MVRKLNINRINYRIMKSGNVILLVFNYEFHLYRVKEFNFSRIEKKTINKFLQIFILIYKLIESI